MAEGSKNGAKRSAGKDIAAVILLLIPFAAYLDLGSFDKVSPTLYGIPYFYWYQTVWLVISAILFVFAALLLNSGRGGKSDVY
ncbi:MAG: DUF3311 domain-containing protein [Thermoplasmata archaeon]|nr:DUF3311 domain-containing protein [Candidatus Sysuiplasma acidicola]MBX8637127.1 DUF3311 domain-containing protein [Candidatus Sysuiplasma acidicola]MBX8646218.1 DUF3311 domain-containing protein [Candidatus Sysuiplasma acidicola]MDH2905600.1 DUF3311 domain-containing protein [Methanomassiliicoccales archaeon]